jgi:hypothetical protein
VLIGLVAVSHAAFGEQVAGMGGVFFELAAQLDHVEPQVVGLPLEAGSPHGGQQLRRAHELAGMPHEQLEYGPLGGGQPERLVGRRRSRRAGAGYLVRGQVDLPAPDDHLGGFGADHGAFLAAQHRPEPGQQLSHRERLGHVVVGAGVERADLVAGAAPAGQHDDRQPVPAAQLDDDVGAGGVGQVENDRVRRPAGGQSNSLPPRACRLHLVEPGLQAGLQCLPRLRPLFDNQDPGSGRPRGGNLPGRKKIAHGPIIADAAVTRR